MNYKIKTPVAFAFFVRDDTALRVFEQIRKAQPERVYLIGEGPRPNRPGEAEKVAALRKKIESMIDWTDKVDLDYVPEDIGCARRLSGGFQNVLNKYGKAILLEDDCVPSQSFFPFQEYLLNKYENNERIACVSGTYFLGKRNTNNLAYGFTHFPQIWGWGAWARSFAGYELDLSSWSDDFLYEIDRSKEIPSFVLKTWVRIFEDIKANPRYTWDMQFWLNCLRKRQLSIFPYYNQISNIGYTPDAEHTSSWWHTNLSTYETSWGDFLHDPNGIDLKYESWLQDNFYWGNLTWFNFYHSVLLWTLLRIKKVRKLIIG